MDHVDGAARTAWSREALGSTQQRFADSIRLWKRATISVPRVERDPLLARGKLRTVAVVAAMRTLLLEETPA
jgi:hypothetical protein